MFFCTMCACCFLSHVDHNKLFLLFCFFTLSPTRCHYGASDRREQRVNTVPIREETNSDRLDFYIIEYFIDLDILNRLNEYFFMCKSINSPAYFNQSSPLSCLKLQ